MTTSNQQITVDLLKSYSGQFSIPVEDATFIALNFSGVDMDVTYNRMRMGFCLNGEDSTFSYANSRNDLYYYFALPVRRDSPFRINSEGLFLNGHYIGKTIGATEDFCDSHYPRRLGTSLNINPNSRTSCRGCDFCYTAYQVPLDKKKLKNAEDIRGFFNEWAMINGKPDLSHLIQVSVLTGCYDSEDDLLNFLLTLNDVLEEFNFGGKVFYLGSMLTSNGAIQKLKPIRSFGYCMSLECFERRDILKGSKMAISLNKAKEIMSECLACGFEVNYTYIVGLESIDSMRNNMEMFLNYTNKFPTINILQLHQQHNRNLLDVSVDGVTFLYRVRKEIETIYKNTSFRPLVWEDYRSLWYLKFIDEELVGDRFPEFFWKDKIGKRRELK